MSFVRSDPTMPADVAHAFPQGSAPTKSEPRSGSADRFVASLLVAKHAVTAAQLDEVFKRRRRTGQRVVDALVADGSITPEAALDAVASHMGISATRINVYTVDAAAVRALPEKVARRHTVFPLMEIDGSLLIATAGPLDLEALDDLQFASGLRPTLVAALESEICAALDRYYAHETWTQTVDGSGDAVVIEKQLADDEARDEEAERSAVTLVERLLSRAVADGASDVHLDPVPSALRVRVRVDGAFHEIANLPATFAPALLSRIKVLAAMDIAEHRLPQDGRFSATVGERRVDIRAATYPTLYGERAVMRLLDQSAARLDLAALGMRPHVLTPYRELIRRPEGIILITGPTGSGKTSTLYATLTELTELDKNIITVENPVEYAVPGISQGQTNDKAGFTFARGLRAILRQDPDVIMVGEIRDPETLQTAIEASLTGHLVISTLHTNSAIGTVARLQEMGVEPYLLASSVLGVVSQRLVRRLCPMCRKDFPRPAGALAIFADLPDTVAAGAGCSNCRGTGHKGRIGLFEFVRMTENLRELVLSRSSEAKLRQAAIAEGSRTLRDEGFARIVAGETTIEEVVRVSQER